MSTKFLFPAINLTPETNIPVTTSMESPKKLSGATLKLILIMFGDVADDNGISWYSHSKMAQKTGCSKSTIKRYIHKLESDGVVSVERRKTANDMNKSNKYFLDFTSLEELYGNTATQNTWGHHEPIGEVTMNPGYVHHEPRVGSPRPTEPTIEPNNEPINNIMSKFSFDKEDYRFAEWMYETIIKTFPTDKKPNYEAWANQIRLMRENDGPVDPLTKKSGHLTHLELGSAFHFATNDNFWSSNVRSPTKLRKHYGSLVKAREEKINLVNTREQKNEVGRQIMDIHNTNW